MAPPSPRTGAQSLPPMLRRVSIESMPSYSEASWGLFVRLRVARIFTGTSISPSPSLRQRPSRYAFHAGRNLPDKGFRYLRTVIVTAAVHRGFGSGREPLPLTFRHWARVSPYTSAYALAETCVFVKQSPGPITCGSATLREVYSHHAAGPPFSLSYGVFLPSSLTRVLSNTLADLRPAYLCRFAVRAPTALTPRIFLTVWGRRNRPWRTRDFPRASAISGRRGFACGGLAYA